MIRIISDIHAANHELFGGVWDKGLNYRAKKILSTLERTVNPLIAGDTLIISGDLFDTRKPDPAVACAVAELLGNLLDKNVFVIVVLGNHELQDSHGQGDNALRFIEKTRTKIIYETAYDEIEGKRFLFIPFRRGNAEIHVQKEAQEHKDVPIDFVLGHYGVAPKVGPLWMSEAEDYVAETLLSKLFPESRVFFGHHHTRITYKEGSILQIGSLCPVGFGDKGITGFGTILDIKDDDIEINEDKGVRFLELTSSIMLPEILKTLPHGAFMRLFEAPSPALTETLIEKGFYWRVLPMKQEKTNDPREKGTGVRTDSDFVLDTTIKYAQGLQIEKELDKDVLVGKLEKIWKQAQSSDS